MSIDGLFPKNAKPAWRSVDKIAGDCKALTDDFKLVMSRYSPLARATFALEAIKAIAEAANGRIDAQDRR